jgi:hypothetical protein
VVRLLFGAVAWCSSLKELVASSAVGALHVSAIAMLLALGWR